MTTDITTMPAAEAAAVQMQRITVCFDGFEADVNEIMVALDGADVIAGEARYSTKNSNNQDSLDLMAELCGTPTHWPIIEAPMDDDSLNCLVLVVRCTPEVAEQVRAAVRRLNEAGVETEIWEDIAEDGSPLTIGQVPPEPAATPHEQLLAAIQREQAAAKETKEEIEDLPEARRGGETEEAWYAADGAEKVCERLLAAATTPPTTKVRFAFSGEDAWLLVNGKVVSFFYSDQLPYPKKGPDRLSMFTDLFTALGFVAEVQEVDLSEPINEIGEAVVEDFPNESVYERIVLDYLLGHHPEVVMDGAAFSLEAITLPRYDEATGTLVPNTAA